MPQQVARLFGSVVAVVAFLGAGIAGSLGTLRASEPENGAALPDERLGVRTAPLLLLSRADIRSDLNVNAQQATDAERAIGELYARAAALRGKSGVEAVEARKAVDDAQRVWFETHLTPEQRNRLVQLDLQWEGPSALVSRPVVADTLALNPAQRAALKSAVALRDESRRKGTHTLSDEQALTRATRAILTTSQWERWLSMLGKSFVPQLAARPVRATR